MRVRVALGVLLLVLFGALPTFAQATYATGFENPPFVLGDVNGQDGWGHIDNSPTGGTVELAPAGSPAALGTQSLALRTRAAANIGVANHLFSPTVSPAAGETGSTAVTIVPDPNSRFEASLWYRTPDTPPISAYPDGRFAELDPSSKGSGGADPANRYVVVRLTNVGNSPAGTPRADLRWITAAGYTGATIASLAWGTWYRVDYTVDLVDGLNGAEPNDRVIVSIYSASGALLGSVCGSTWEVGYKDAAYGFGGGTTPRAINGFDFWSLATPNGTLVGHLDDLSMGTSDSPAALQVAIGGTTSVCYGGTTTLTANVSGGSGSITSYMWLDAILAVVGTGSSLIAPAGTYTVTVRDTECGVATSVPVIVQTTCKATPTVNWNDPADIVYGTLLSGTQLNATASVPGTFVYTPAAGTQLNAGNDQGLTVDFYPTDSTNYENVLGTTVQINVLRAPTSITITGTSPNPSTVGEAVTVSFTLNGIIGSSAGSVGVAGGEASCTTTAAFTSCTMVFPASGSFPLTATFAGDSNHLPSVSPQFVHQVDTIPATAVVSGTATLCSGGLATLRVDLTGLAPFWIVWSDGFEETTSDPVHFRMVGPSQTTTYTITKLVDGNGAGSASGSATITPVSLAAPSITTSGQPVLGQPLTLRASDGYTSYQWLRNGVVVAGETQRELTIPSLAAQDLASYSVRGLRDGCVSPASSVLSLVLLGLPTDVDAVIPVIGNTEGLGGSSFRTTLQLTNATVETCEVEIRFIDTSLPVRSFTLNPYETRFVHDLLPSTYHGLTSANVRRIRGPLPVILAHVFDDGGASGTSGLIERAIPLAESLVIGDRAVLLTPANATTTRMNVGLRSLASGLTVRITRRSRTGAVLGTFDRLVPPFTLEHLPLQTLLGSVAGNSESLTFEVLGGRGVVYAAATDNGTNDPNLQIAAPARSFPHSGRFVLPVAGSTLGEFGSRFSTGLQLHNPTATPFTATLTFRPHAFRGGAALPTRSFEIAPGATESFDDVVAAIQQGLEGLGSLDLTVPITQDVVTLARVYNIGPNGEASLTTPLLAEEDALIAGETGVVTAPHAPAAQRLNLGLRALASGVRLSATVRSSSGTVLRVVPLSLATNASSQASAETLLGVSFQGDESVTFTIEEGSAVIYATWTDNTTQDPSLQFATRP
jgi:hypothetical protein